MPFHSHLLIVVRNVRNIMTHDSRGLWCCAGKRVLTRQLAKSTSTLRAARGTLKQDQRESVQKKIFTFFHFCEFTSLCFIYMHKRRARMLSSSRRTTDTHTVRGRVRRCASYVTRVKKRNKLTGIQLLSLIFKILLLFTALVNAICLLRYGSRLVCSRCLTTMKKRKNMSKSSHAIFMNE